MSGNKTFENFIKEEQQKPYFKRLLTLIEQEAQTNTIYPPKENWFKAFELTPFENVKVVLIGQDPYHNPNQAMGLAFAVKEGIALPPSLVNIYKEISAEYGVTMPRHGDLSNWAKQGVLLLNTLLTVSHNKPLSHQGFGWENFSNEVIKKLQEKEFIVYILLGGHAKSYIPKITNKNHLILQTSHPSPLSSYRGFLGSNIFKETNQALTKKGISPIKWEKI